MLVTPCMQQHQLVQAWSQVETGLVMSGAGYIMERFQRNVGVRLGGHVSVVVIYWHRINLAEL